MTMTKTMTNQACLQCKSESMLFTWNIIAPDNRGIQINSSLISPQKHMLVLLMSTHNMFLWRNNSNFQLKKTTKNLIWNYDV